MRKQGGYTVYIPVRGGSKSIPLKNIKCMNGRPLVWWTIDAAVNCPYIDKVYIGTDSVQITEKVEEYKSRYKNSDKLSCIERAAHTVTDTASTESAMIDFANKYEFDKLVLIQATSPLLKSKDITQAIEQYEEKHYDSLLSVVEQKRFIWESKEGIARPVNYDYNKRPRRQEFQGYMVENGAFYITSRSALLESGCRLSGKIGMYPMDEETYFEIDEPDDWLIIENLMKKTKRKIEEEAPVSIKLFATDCDGCLTDAGMYYSDSGEEMKKFSTVDGMGFGLLREAGIKTAIITGEKTQLVENRANKLEISFLRMGVRDKLKEMSEIAEELGISLLEVAYVGDDINDVELLQNVGMSFAVANARQEAKNAAKIVLDTEGGKGAVRDAIEYVLQQISHS